MDMSGFGGFVKGDTTKVEIKELAIDAFHHHCFVSADSPSAEDVEASVRAYFDYPDERAKAILHQAAFTVNDVLEHAATIEVGSEKHKRLITAQERVMQEDAIAFDTDDNTPI